MPNPGTALRRTGSALAAAGCLALLLAGLVFLAAVALGARTDSAAEVQPGDVQAGQGGDGVDSTGAGDPEAAPGIRYAFRLDGSLTDSARDLFMAASLLQREINRLPADLGLLRRRARDDAQTLVQVLRSEGFFNAQVGVEVLEEASPVEVVLHVDEGNVFLLREARIEFVGTAIPPELPPDLLEDLGLHIGMAAVSSEILSVEAGVIDYLKNRGRPYVRLAERDASVILSEEVMDVVFRIDPGPAMTFGALVIEGTEEVDPEYISQRVPWAIGQPYDSSRVSRFRDSLAQSGLFTLVTASPPRRPPDGEDGAAPVTVLVNEALHRSVGAGALYSTTDGPGARAFWEHRNLLGMGQSLRLSAVVSQLSNSADVTFRWPWYMVPRQTLVAQAAYGSLKTDAYDVIGPRAYLGVERPLMENWQWGLGVSLEQGRVTAADGTQNVQLLGLPLTLSRDTSNDLLNPTSGLRLSIELTPLVGRSDDTLTLLRNRADAAFYLPLDTARDFVVASRVQVGSIVGETRSTIPANKRFYVGGGGSLRGYKYQSVSPLNAQNKPIGGKSMFAFSTELRWRFMDDFGLVPFVDAGNAFSTPYPDFTEGLQWATGLGFRYYTPIGPARLDLAFPLNARSIDRSFEFYVSLGQAF